MLIKNGIQGLNNILYCILEMRNRNVRITEVKVIDWLSYKFDMYLIIYQIYDILLEYERSGVEINVKKGENYEQLYTLTSKELFRELEGDNKGHILYNFGVLDKVLLKMAKKDNAVLKIYKKL